MPRRPQRTEQQRLAGLAALLAQSDATWRQVTAEIAWWPVPAQERAVALIEAQGARWPTSVRDLSPIACSQLSEGHVQPYHRLIRCLDMRLLWRYRNSAQLLSRLIHEAGLHTLWSFTLRYCEGRPVLELLMAHVGGLRQLSLGSSGLGDADVLALAQQAPALAGLEDLSLYANQITDVGADALLSSPHLRALRSVNLYGNRLSQACVERLRAAPRWVNASLILHKQHLG